MAKQQAETSRAVDPAVFLKSMGGDPFEAKELANGLGLKGSELLKTVNELLDSGVLRSLGKGHSIDKDGEVTPGPTRFKANLPSRGGKFWVLMKKGYGAPVDIPGIGRVDCNGRLIELTGGQRQRLESRDFPVEVITDSDKIMHLKEVATGREAKVAKVIDRRQELLDEIAG